MYQQIKYFEPLHLYRHRNNHNEIYRLSSLPQTCKLHEYFANLSFKDKFLQNSKKQTYRYPHHLTLTYTPL